MKDHAKQNEREDHNAGTGWLIFCAVGMITSLTMYGVVLEYATSGDRKLHEISFVFVTTSIYTITAYLARWLFGEKPTVISKYPMLLLSLTSIASTFTSVRSLRYVIYPVQVLFKSCKPVPVMLFGFLLGKRYPMKKYVNVIIITTGVALFMGGGKSSSSKSMNTSGGLESGSTFLGAIMLSISLCFDGATGAYEDKLMQKDHVEPFDLMYNIQLGKAIISFCTLIAINELPDFLNTLQYGGFSLILLGFTGALGQVFVFVTISKFGALNCALIGLGRKILSLLLSFILYKHSLNAIQVVGLTLAVVAMVANFYEKGAKKSHPQHVEQPQEELEEMEALIIEEEAEENRGRINTKSDQTNAFHQLQLDLLTSEKSQFVPLTSESENEYEKRNFIIKKNENKLAVENLEFTDMSDIIPTATKESIGSDEDLPQLSQPQFSPLSLHQSKDTNNRSHHIHSTSSFPPPIDQQFV